MGPNVKQMREIQISIFEIESKVFETEMIPIDVFQKFKASHLYPECYEKLNDVFHEHDFQEIVSCLIQNSNEFFMETNETGYSLITDVLGKLVDDSDEFYLTGC